LPHLYLCLCPHNPLSAALRAKLEEDRKERRRKLGLPEELTEEEKAREADKARKKAEEEEAKRHVCVKPISGACGVAVCVYECMLDSCTWWQQAAQSSAAHQHSQCVRVIHLRMRAECTRRLPASVLGPQAQLLPEFACLRSLACSPARSFCPATTVIEKLRGQLVSMKKAAAGDEAFKTCVSTQLKYIGNVARAPDEDKFRSINMGNAAFQARVASVSGAVDFFKLLGFQVWVGVAGEARLGRSRVCWCGLGG
jgi:hypothetical protein